MAFIGTQVTFVFESRSGSQNPVIGVTSGILNHYCSKSKK